MVQTAATCHGVDVKQCHYNLHHMIAMESLFCKIAAFFTRFLHKCCIPMIKKLDDAVSRWSKAFFLSPACEWEL